MKPTSVRIVSLSVAAAAALLFTGCASIVSKSNWPVQLGSTPAGAKVVVRDQKGAEIFAGVTPTQVTLKSGAGYFKSASYKLEFTKEGCAPQTVELRSRMNGWYIGNIVFGGLIGLLIVDPATGAMYRLDESVNPTLTPLASDLKPGELRIVSIEALSAQERQLLVRAN